MTPEIENTTTKLIFFRSRVKWYANALRWMTGGNVSHAGFLMKDGDTVISQRRTLAVESLSKDLSGRPHFTLELPKGVTVDEAELARLVVLDAQTALLTYGWMDYLWFVPRRLTGAVVNWPGFICSEFVWAVMFSYGWNVVLHVPSPHSLMKAVQDAGTLVASDY